MEARKVDEYVSHNYIDGVIFMLIPSDDTPIITIQSEEDDLATGVKSNLQMTMNLGYDFMGCVFPMEIEEVNKLLDQIDEESYDFVHSLDLVARRSLEDTNNVFTLIIFSLSANNIFFGFYKDNKQFKSRIIMSDLPISISPDKED